MAGTSRTGGVGTAVICDRCQEYAVVIRHTRYLADRSEQALKLLLQELVDDDLIATVIAQEQGKP